MPDAARADGSGDRPLLKSAEFRELLNVSVATFERLRAKGKLPKPIHLGSRLLRWDRSLVAEWIAANCPDPKTWKPSKGK